MLHGISQLATIYSYIHYTTAIPSYSYNNVFCPYSYIASWGIMAFTKINIGISGLIAAVLFNVR